MSSDIQTNLCFMPPVALCNRCNAQKPGNGPCVCGCPEFRLVGWVRPKKEVRKKGSSVKR